MSKMISIFFFLLIVHLFPSNHSYYLVVVLPHILLLNDDSTITLPFYQRKVFIAGATAAKMLVLRWEPPHTFCTNKWKF